MYRRLVSQTRVFFSSPHESVEGAWKVCVFVKILRLSLRL